MEESMDSPESAGAPAGVGQGGPSRQTPPVETKAAPGEDARLWAMFCHLAGLAIFAVPFPLTGIIAPLIVWQIKKDEHPFVDENGKEAVNFQISILIYAAISALLCLVLIGFLLLPAVVVFDIVCLIIAAVRANHGERFVYPLCIRFIK
jgi:uncharacterized Tic20 family protein